MPNSETALYNILERMLDWKLRPDKSGIEGLRDFCRYRDEYVEISGEDVHSINEISWQGSSRN